MNDCPTMATPNYEDEQSAVKPDDITNWLFSQRPTDSHRDVIKLPTNPIEVRLISNQRLPQ